MSEQPRESSGRFGAKPAPVSMTPITDLLNAAAERTRSMALLVPPPAPIEDLNKARVRTGIHSDPTEVDPDGANIDDCRRISLMKTWLTDTAKVGVTADLRRAWEAWEPVWPMPKHSLREHYDRLHKQCAVKEMELTQQAQREMLLQHARGSLMAAVNRCQDQMRKAEEDLSRAQVDLAVAEERLAAFDAEPLEAAS